MANLFETLSDATITKMIDDILRFPIENSRTGYSEFTKEVMRRFVKNTAELEKLRALKKTKM